MCYLYLLCFFLDSKHSVEASNDVMMRSPLMRIESFLMSLTSPGEDGRIVISTDGVGGRCLKYVLMNPAFHFKDLLEVGWMGQAHSGQESSSCFTQGMQIGHCSWRNHATIVMHH